MHKPLRVAVLALLVSSSGCFFEGDKASGRLSVRLRFAGVHEVPDEIEWWLYEVSQGRRALVESGDEDRTIDGLAVVRFSGLRPGEYELAVKATDGDVRWASGCAGLLLDRFEELYDCDVWREEDDDGEPDDEDGGEAGDEDAGTD